MSEKTVLEQVNYHTKSPTELVPAGVDSMGRTRWKRGEVDLEERARKLQLKRRMARIRRGMTAIAATGAVVFAGIKGHEAIAHDPAPEAVPVATMPDHERSIEGICAPLSDAAERLLITDCNLLPEFSKVNGYGDDGETPVATGDNLVDLNTDYKEAFEAACSDPLGKLITEKFPVEIYQQTATTIDGTPTGARDGGEFDSEQKKLRFKFVLDQPGEVYKTYGAVRTVLIHEGTHGLYHEWMQDTDDPTTQANRQKLTDLWKQDAQIILEEVRTKHGDELRAGLSQARAFMVRKQAEDPNSGRANVLEAIDMHTAQLDKPNGLADISIIQDESEPYPASAGPIEVIGRTANYFWDEDFSVEKGEFKILQALDKPYGQTVTEMTAFTSETPLTDGLTAGGGWPYQNPDEKTASLLTTIQMNPEGVVQTTNQLPPERRDLHRESIATLQDQLRHTQPDAEKLTNLQYVLDRIQQ